MVTAIFLYIIVAVVVKAGKVTQDNVPRDWQCGYTNWDRADAYIMVRNQCSAALFEANYCCENHDYCYDQQFGKTNCDDTFCNCLDAKVEEFCPKNTTFGHLFCGAVRLFGLLAYRAAANETKPGINMNINVNVNKKESVDISERTRRPLRSFE